MRFLLAFLFAVVLFINPAEAQLGGLFKKQKERAEQRAKDRANQDVNNETDKTVDKAYDSVKKGLKGLFGKKKKKDGDSEDEDISDEDMIEETLENISIEEESETDGAVTVSGKLDYTPSEYVCSFDTEMEMYKKGKLRKNGRITNTFIIDRDKSMMKIKIDGNTTKMLFLPAKRRVYTYPGTGNMMISTKMKRVKFKAGNEGGYKITKTEEFKEVDGRRCRKYLAESEDYNSIAWIDESVDIDFTKVMSNFGFKYDIKNSPFGSKEGEIMGLPVMAESTSKNGKEKTIVRYKNFKLDNIDRSVFDISQYKVIGF